MDSTTLHQLLNEFTRLPKMVKQPTYLELCKYPGRRFEEICSRLLTFYLDPKKEHGFHDLFLQSLFKMLGITDIEYSESDITAKCEANAEGKRLDILVKGRTFAIGIENKIHAALYNPFEKYKELLEEQSDKKFLLVLSLRELDENENSNLRENNISFYTYKKYFDIVKDKLGNYVPHGNLKYLAFITDFIETMENMRGGSAMNRELEDFFFYNSNKIDEMNNLYETYKTERWQKVIDRRDELQTEMVERTHEKKVKPDEVGWWIWEDWLLGYTSPSGLAVNVYFDTASATRDNPLGECKVSIVIKNNNEKAREVWRKVSEKTKLVYPVEVLHGDYNTSLPIAVIPADDNEVIIQKIQELYEYLKNLPL